MPLRRQMSSAAPPRRVIQEPDEVDDRTMNSWLEHVAAHDTYNSETRPSDGLAETASILFWNFRNRQPN